MHQYSFHLNFQFHLPRMLQSCQGCWIAPPILPSEIIGHQWYLLANVHPNDYL